MYCQVYTLPLFSYLASDQAECQGPWSSCLGHLVHMSRYKINLNTVGCRAKVSEIWELEVVVIFTCDAFDI